MKDRIPHDTYEQFIRLFVAQEGRLRAFLRTLVPSLDELDEVMQETSLVAWRKVTTELRLPPQTQFLVVHVEVARSQLSREPIEFAGHYVDAMELVLHTERKPL